MVIQGSDVDNYPPILKVLGDPFEGFGLPFLARVQRLHDESRNWNATGLSPDGVLAVLKICKVFGLDFHNVCYPTQ